MPRGDISTQAESCLVYGTLAGNEYKFTAVMIKDSEQGKVQFKI